MKSIKRILNHKFTRTFFILVILGVSIYALIFEAIIPGYDAEWTGFDFSEEQNYKTLWDWLEILIIPIVIGGAGVYLSRYFLAKSEREENRKLSLEERETDREVALNKKEDQEVNDYLNKMTELLIDNELLTTTSPEILSVAKARTSTILMTLSNENRKAIIIHFMRTSNLLKVGDKFPLLKDSDMAEVDLRSARLSEADFSRAYLRSANLSRANLSGADLSAADLIGSDLSYANLFLAKLIAANLLIANLSSTNLRGANLREADLSEADLSEADLESADLRGAKLIGVELRKANLSGANLSEANLSGANLSEANLKNARYLKNKQLAKVTSLKNTTMPNGQVYSHSEVSLLLLNEVFPGG